MALHQDIRSAGIFSIDLAGLPNLSFRNINIIFGRLLQAGEISGVDDLEQVIKAQKGFHEFIFGEDIGFSGSDQFIQIDDFNKSIRIDYNICQKICDDICIGRSIIVIIDNIAIPEEQ